MLKVAPPKYQKRSRPRVQFGAPPPVVTGPVLVEAAYDAGSQVLSLRFDREINIGAIIPAVFEVFDGPNSFRLTGSNASLDTPERVIMNMDTVDHATYEGVRMTAGAENGIVDAESAEWIGVSELELPYTAP